MKCASVPCCGRMHCCSTSGTAQAFIHSERWAWTLHGHQTLRRRRLKPSMCSSLTQLPVPRRSTQPALNYRFNGFLESALLAPAVRASQLRLRTGAGQSCPGEGGCAAAAPATCEEGGRPPAPGRSGPSSLRLPSGEVVPHPLPPCEYASCLHSVSPRRVVRSLAGDQRRIYSWNFTSNISSRPWPESLCAF